MFSTHHLSRLRLTFGRGRSLRSTNDTSSRLRPILPSSILFDQSLSHTRERRWASRQAKFLFYLFFHQHIYLIIATLTWLKLTLHVIPFPFHCASCFSVDWVPSRTIISAFCFLHQVKIVFRFRKLLMPLMFSEICLRVIIWPNTSKRR